MATMFYDSLNRSQADGNPAGDAERQQANLRKALKRSGQRAFLGSLALSAGLCWLVYLAIAPTLSLAGAEVTLRYILASSAAIPAVVLWIAFRSLLWNRAVAERQAALLEQRFVSRCLDRARANAIAFSPRERATLDAVVEAEDAGSPIAAKQYARALRMVLPVSIGQA